MFTNKIICSKTTNLSFSKLFRNQHQQHHQQQQRQMSMEVFNRKIKKIQKDHSVYRSDNPKEFDWLREEIGKRLTDRLDDILKRKYKKVLELGANSGLLAQYIQDEKYGVETYYQLDISDKLLHRDKEEDQVRFPRVKPTRIVGDEESFNFEDGSLDLVISNLSLHWVNDLPKTLQLSKKALKSDGVFLGAILGEHSLRELRSSFVLAEQEREGGVSAHVSPFAGIGDVGNLLTRAQFALPTIDSEQLTVNYSSPWKLMEDLQGMAENNAALARKPFSSRDTMMSAAAIYQSLYGNPQDGTVPATFQVIYFIGWVPDPSQQKAKARGSAQVSLKTIGDGKTLR